MAGVMFNLGDIIGFLKDIWEELKWWIFVYPYEEVVVTRNGHFKHKRIPGLYFKIPFFDDVFRITTVPTTYDLKPQTLITKDGKTVTVVGMVKAQVNDSVTYALKVYDQKDALGDTTMGVIARTVMDSTFEQLTDVSINNAITTKARVQAKKYGIDVMQVTLISIAQSRAYHLFSDGKPELNSK